MTGVLDGDDLARIDAHLKATDDLLSTAYPGDDGSRQPVHTVYVPADQFTPDLTARWGAQALAAAEDAGGLENLAVQVGVNPAVAGVVAEGVRDKLLAHPIEDLRLDFEDGYGDRGSTEDEDLARAARQLTAAASEGTLPPFVGIRIKSLEKPTRARALRTLAQFIAEVLTSGGLPESFLITLPKVSTVAQVEAMVVALAAIERAHGLSDGTLQFEVQVETPQVILGADGRSPLPQFAAAARGRIAGLHFGTYDYTASLEIAAGYQSLEHPAADHAKAMMQLAAAGTGIRLSDGSTNILPVGDRRAEAWALHARLVRRSLERGFYQG